jgi:hemerythrin superfamily protein
MDAVDLLKTDHRLVEGLFNQVQGTRGKETRKTLFTKIVEELSAHASVEEQVRNFPVKSKQLLIHSQVLYPTLRRLQKSDKLADHSIQEHQEMKETLEKLRHMDVLDAQFDTDFNKLVLSVTHHVQEEESLIFTELRYV